MAGRAHRYSTTLAWTGNRGEGTSTYRSYGRDHVISAAGKPDLPASADRTFRGDRDRWNPEELLVAALSGCHMLSYLHACAVAGVVVVAYEDGADGVMTETDGGGGRFERVTLRPVVTVTEESMRERALELHARAHELCFIASSVDFPVGHEPEIRTA